MVNVTVTQGGATIWTFIAVRPAASSGFPGKGSGIELRYVRYKGKMVLWRGHLPILNVEYDKQFCGPYRDWQNSEVCFKANGTDVPGTGFRLCSSPAQTLADTPNDDCGNFRGVAIYVQGQDVVLVSELEASWYRYIPMWVLSANGTIQPRFGLAATSSGCTCHTHFHHAYFRLDLDIQSVAAANSVDEYEKSGGALNLVKTFDKEGKTYRASADKKWRVRNSSGKYYEIFPGAHDESALGDF